MNENAPIADSDEHPKDQYDDKKENVFLRETESHTQVPAVRITSIILVIASIIMTLMFLTQLGERDTTQKKSHQGEKNQTETDTDEQ